jgi:hypothetical protein
MHFAKNCFESEMIWKFPNQTWGQVIRVAVNKLVFSWFASVKSVLFNFKRISAHHFVDR